MDQNSSNLSFFIGNSRTFLFKTKEIIENSTFRKNKFPDLPEKVRNDKPGLVVYGTGRTVKTTAKCPTSIFYMTLKQY